MSKVSIHYSHSNVTKCMCDLCTHVLGNALIQMKLVGPTDNCVQWPWNMETDVRRAVFNTMMDILQKYYCSCVADIADWGYSCRPHSNEVVFKYSLHMTSQYCNCSGSEVASIMEKWVESAGTVRMNGYLLRVNHDCLPTKIQSLDDPECN